jgi:cytochrome c551/c552
MWAFSFMKYDNGKNVSVKVPHSLLLAFLLHAPLWAQVVPVDGHAIYEKHCASCHGDNGEGVDDEYDEALIGKRSVNSLAEYIHEWMPEFKEHLVVDADALAVAEYIHGAFYSPEAQARIAPARKALLRLDRYQHRNAITDLVASFRWQRNDAGKRGVEAEYTSFSEGKDNRKREKVLKRVEDDLSFQKKDLEGISNLNVDEFSITWTGSVVPPESGSYDFRIQSPNGVRLFINEIYDHEKTVIDGWVSSNNEMRELTGQAELLGGYPVSIKVDFLSFQEKDSSLVVEWKPPHGTWQTIPKRLLWPEHTAPLAIISTQFPADDASLGYERGSSISKTWQDATAKAAIEASLLIKDDLNQIAGTQPDEGDYDSKIREFCHQFATRAFGRPLSPEEAELYIERQFEKTEVTAAAQRSLLLTLSSPHFLYPELSEAEGDFQIARRLALALWDSVPDKQLRQLAEKGHLHERSQIEEEAKRMLKDPRAHQKMTRFYHHWLGLAEREFLEKDEKAFPDFDKDVIADLRTSLDILLEEVTWSSESDYRKFFLTRDLHLNKRLADFYNIPSSSEDGFTRRTISKHPRAGVLTHPYLLAAFSYRDQTSPIHRGVYFGRNILGRYLKPPPEAIEFKDSDFDPTLTMREKVTALTRESSCMSCHQIINPVGFSLEKFDAVGRFREQEKGRPINTHSDYPTPDDRTLELSGPEDLARLAIESPEAHRAFIRQLFNHLVQQPVAAFGTETMDQLHTHFVRNDFNIQKLIVEIVTLSAGHSQFLNP